MEEIELAESKPAATAAAEEDSNNLLEKDEEKTESDNIDKKNGNKKEKKKKLPKASIRELFSFATPIDYCLMLIGVLAAVAQGAALPFAMLLLGDVINTFINNQVSRSTVDLYNGLNLTSFNNSNDSLYFTATPDQLNCSLMLPVVQYYYSTELDINCLTNDQFNQSVNGDTAPIMLSIGSVNCTVLEDTFASLYGSVAQCLDKDSFIAQVNSEIFYFIAIACGAFLMGYLMIQTFHLASERQVYKMRLAYYRAVLRQDIAWFDLNPAGEVSSRLSDDLDKILAGIGDKLVLFFQWISTFFAGFAIGFVRDWRLTLVLLGLVPFLALGGALMSWVTAHFTTLGQQSYATAGAIAEEVLSSVRTVIAFGGEYRETKKYDREIRDGRILGAKKGLGIGLSISYFFFLLFISYAVAFWFGGWLVSADLAQGGEILTVFFSVLIGAFAIGQAFPNLESFGTALGAAGTVIATIKRTPAIDSSSNEGFVPEGDEVLENSVQFKEVSFTYPARPDVEVLNSFSLSVAVGQTVALVGHSGCGKSTIMQLLQRFYDPTSGEVSVGAKPVKDINTTYLRSIVGCVSQEPVLFDFSILENIKFGNHSASMEEIERAAKDANVHDFIKGLPDGYDTLVGERGTQLSGGQKQRVAIARALVRDPKILLLDEATSALDSESERQVQEALERASKGRTTIVIAHRLSTIQNADLIVVVDDGNIVETGCHGDLMKQHGQYYDMVVTQSKGVDDAYINISEGAGPAVLPVAASRQISRQFSKQESHVQNHQPITVKKLNKEEILKKKQAEWDKELASVPFAKLMALNSKEWYLIALGVVGAAVNGSIFPLFAIIFGELLNVLSFTRDEVLDAVHLPAGLFVVLAFVSAIAIFVKTICFIVSGEFLTERIRSRLFKAMLRQEMGWFDEEKHSTGALTTRLSEDAAQVQGATGTRLATMVETFVSLILALIIAFVYSWALTLAILGFVPFIVLSSALKTILLLRHANRNKKAQSEAGKLAVDSIENMRTVTSLNLQPTFVTLYTNEVKEPYRVGLLLGSLEGVAYGISQGMIFFGYVIAFRFGAFIVSLDSDHLIYTEFENVLRVLFALMFGALAVGQASAFAPNIAKAKVSANRIFSLLDREPIIDNYSTDGQTIDKFSGEISLNEVSFNYPTRPDVPVLQELSLSVKPGQTVALVGPSGCGKSTVVSLLERFYDPLKGSVQLDGVAVTDMNIRWLRTQLGIVSQEPVLFDDSIAENIRYGANHREDSISDEEVVEAARAANIHDFIQSLPQGYNTNVGDKGTQLSGGQKQRVAIARALIRNPKILLLDEATSALDSESEKIVQEALDKAREGRTCVVIAHRLSTIQTADCIVVVTKGEVLEMGTHTELLSKGGLYYQLYQHQQLATEA